MYFNPEGFEFEDEEPQDYDNDETFGSGAVQDDDWEEKHQAFSRSLDSSRLMYDDNITFDDHGFANDKMTFEEEEFLAHSVSEMVLEEEEHPTTPTKTIPIPYNPDKTFPESPYSGGIWTAATSPPIETCRSPSSSWHGDNSPGKMLLQMLKSGALTPPSNKNIKEVKQPYNAQQTKAKLAAIPARHRSSSYSENTNPRVGGGGGGHGGGGNYGNYDRRYQHHGNQHGYYNNNNNYHNNYHRGRDQHHGYRDNYNNRDNYNGYHGNHHNNNNNNHHSQNRRHHDNNRNQRNNRNDKLPQEMDSILMSSSEKQWVTKIQMLQIQTANPYEEDYYYQMLLFKKQQKDTDFLVTPKLLFSNPAKHSDKKEYKPMEFSSTLGKLSISTVMNPRQVLDCSLNDLQPIITNHQKEVIDPGRKKYSVLSTIERMYDYLLELEDLERMLLIVPAEERSKIIDAKNEVADRMFSCFCISDSGSINEELLVHVLSTSKGKNMLARSVTQLRSEHGRAILYHLLGNMATIIAHDKKHQQLPQLCEPLGSVIHSGTINMMHVWMKSLVDGLSYYGDLGHSLATVLSNPLGISLINDIIQRADHLCAMNPANLVQSEWIRVLQQIYPYMTQLFPTLPSSKALTFLKDSLAKNRNLLWLPKGE